MCPHRILISALHEFDYHRVTYVIAFETWHTPTSTQEDELPPALPFFRVEITSHVGLLLQG